MIFRTPWSAFPDAAVQTTVGKLTGRETHFLAQVPTREKMQALVAASHKVRPLLNPIGEYDHLMEQLLKDGLSITDARKQLEVKKPDLVSARDNQVMIQRRA